MSRALMGAGHGFLMGEGFRCRQNSVPGLFFSTAMRSHRDVRNKVHVQNGRSASVMVYRRSETDPDTTTSVMLCRITLPLPEIIACEKVIFSSTALGLPLCLAINRTGVLLRLRITCVQHGAFGAADSPENNDLTRPPITLSARSCTSPVSS